MGSSSLQRCFNELKEYRNNLKTYSFLRLIILVALLLISGFLMLFTIGYNTSIVSIILCVLSLSLLVGFTFYEYKYRGQKINYIPLTTILVLCIAMFVVLILQPLSYTISLYGYQDHLIEATIDIDNGYKIRAFCSYIGLLICLYNLVFLFPKSVKENRPFFIIAFSLLILTSFVFCIISLCIEGSNYIDLIKNLNNNPQQYATKFVFAHRNNWGFFMLVALWSSILLSYLVHSKRLLFLPFIFYSFMMFSLCKTAIAIGGLVLLSCSIYLSINTYKQNKRQGTILISIISVSCLAVLLICLLTPIKDMIAVFVTKGGGDSLEARTIIWSKVIQMTSTPLKVLFGNGYKILAKNLFEINNADIYYSANWGTFTAHNMYLQVLGDGGILFLLAFLSLITYMWFSLIKYYKYEKVFVFILMVGFAALLGMWFFES